MHPPFRKSLATAALAWAALTYSTSPHAYTLAERIASEQHVAAALEDAGAMADAAVLRKFISDQAQQHYGRSSQQGITAMLDVVDTLLMQRKFLAAERIIREAERLSGEAFGGDAFELFTAGKRSMLERNKGNIIHALSHDWRVLSLVGQYLPNDVHTKIAAQSRLAEDLIRLGQHQEAKRLLSDIEDNLNDNVATGKSFHYSIMGWRGVNDLALHDNSAALSCLEEAMSNFILYNYSPNGWVSAISPIGHLPSSLVSAYWENRGQSPDHLKEAFRAAGWAEMNSTGENIIELSDRLSGISGAVESRARIRDMQNEYLDRAEGFKALAHSLMTSNGDALDRAIIEGYRVGLWMKPYMANSRPFTNSGNRLALLKKIAPGLEEVKTALRSNEVLIRMVHVKAYGNAPAGYIVFGVTKGEQQWVRIESDLTNEVELLRCGLDRDGEWEFSNDAKRLMAKRAMCRQRFPGGIGSADLPPFDVATAGRVYNLVIKPFEALIGGREVVAVLDGPVSVLPLGILIKSKQHTGRMSNLASEDWFGLKTAISVWPTVASFVAMRTTTGQRRLRGVNYMGFGNPLLFGRSLADKSALDSQECSRGGPPLQPSLRGKKMVVRRAPSLDRSIADAESIRAIDPLPDTAKELCSVAEALGVSNLANSVFLGRQATEGHLKALSKLGILVNVSILHFATHGLLARETALYHRGKAEPALVLTPPITGSDDDDGLLTSTEVMRLDLDADWVILSACNTAAGEALGGGGSFRVGALIFLCGRAGPARISLVR